MNPSVPWISPKAGRVAGFVSLAVCALLSTGCPALRSAPTPMPSQIVQSSDSSCAVVFLPGMFDKPGDFARQGFDAAVRDAGLDLHLVAADAHFGYYRKRSVIVRLRQDLIQPLVDDGKKVWLVGISLGGAGSLLYARDHSEDLEGVLLLAPFLGDERFLRDLQAQGGPLEWRPPETLAEDDVGSRLWSWIQIWHQNQESMPEIYLGFGEKDDLAPGHRLLAGLLPKDHVARHPGDHDWKAWLPLWRELLSSDAFAGC